MKGMLFMKRTVLFGASKRGQVAYDKLKDDNNIVAFVDNDKNKQGTNFCGLKVYNPEILKDNDYNVIISSMYDIEIVKQLIEYGVKKFSIFEIVNDNFEVKKFNYSNIDDFSINPKRITLVIENHSGSNTFALLKKASENILKKYEISVLYRNWKNKDYYLNILTSKMFIYTHDSSYDDDRLNVQLWHGFPLKGLSYMSRYLDKEKKEKYHKEWEKLDCITSYSKTYSTLMNASYGVDGNKYIITGMPRNDLLLSSNGKIKLSEILNLDLSGKRVIFYMPTFRKTFYGEENGVVNKFKILDVHGFSFELFNDFLEENNIILILKYHPAHVEQAKSYIKTRKINNLYIIEDDYLRNKELDLYEILNAADLLITDYSSVYFDYLLLDRPIIFTPLDLEEYRENRGFLLEPYEFWTPGPKCYTFEQLTKEIKKVLKDDSYYKKERETICNIVHHYKDANSSERVWKLIDELMDNN